MDQYLKETIMNRLHTTAKALKQNRMEAHVVEDLDALREAVKTLLPMGAVVCAGGSMTLVESGIDQLLREGDYDYYFRGRTDPEGKPIDVLRKAFTCDWFFSGSNAITLDGQLYNTDGNANRVAALAFGPQHVVVVAGYNKIVKDLDEAAERLRAIAAPANCQRLGLKNGCHTTGHCVDCHSETRICCTTVIQGHQRVPGRITVFLLPMELGY